MASNRNRNIFVARVVDEPQIGDFTQSVTIQPFDGTDNSFDNKFFNMQGDFDNTYIKLVTSKYKDIHYGDVLSVSGTTTAPRNFGSQNGRTFDYVDYLLKDNIISIVRSNDVSVIKTSGVSVTGLLFKMKGIFMNSIRQVLGEPEASLAGGLVVGEKDSLGKELLNDFRKVGLIHIVVLSGYNITIIATTIQRILSFLPEVLGNILGGIGIILFGVLVGGGATVVRSCIMAIIAIISGMIGRRYEPARALIVAALIMIFINPLVILYDPSFQLSFVATAGLIWLSPFVGKLFQWVPEKFGMRELVISTTSTQLAVTPLLVHMMGQISVLGVFANILVLPLIPVTMLFISLTGIAGIFSIWASWPFAAVTHLFLSYELFIVTKFAAIPWVSISF
ncbi:MAG: ComEC/Rec2 family competence protein [Patescibacteria group bacterium]|nr:ComEC/Rec2 family competence protein [Patescibacteria group bacterium]